MIREIIAAIVFIIGGTLVIGAVGSLFSGAFLTALVSLPVGCLISWWGISIATKEFKPESAKRPCPRCSHHYVDLYHQGNWDYFTCGGCGARGWYPFRTAEARRIRLANQ